MITPYFSKASLFLPLTLALLSCLSYCCSRPSFTDSNCSFPKVVSTCVRIPWVGIRIPRHRIWTSVFPGYLPGILYTEKNLCLKSAFPSCFLSLHSFLGQLHAWHFLSVNTYILINHNHSFQLKTTSLPLGPLYSHLLYISTYMTPRSHNTHHISPHTHSNVCS